MIGAKNVSEFSVIDTYFSRHRENTAAQNGISPCLWGGGDDAAVLEAAAIGDVDVVSVDQLVENQHFYSGMSAADIGHKALAVALSDLAAMAATPHSVLLSLTLPPAYQQDHVWLQAFSDAFYALADQMQVRLIGGNLSSGEAINISVSVWGRAPRSAVVYRHGAQLGDSVMLLGQLGAAAAGWDCYRQRLPQLSAEAQQVCLQCWQRPYPLCVTTPALQAKVHAAIDVSDGLLADLGHMLRASSRQLSTLSSQPHVLGARLFADSIPASPALQSLPRGQQLGFALQGGEDYALCIALSAAQKTDFLSAIGKLQRPGIAPQITCTEIGVLTDSGNIEVVDAQGDRLEFSTKGWQHF